MKRLCSAQDMIEAQWLVEALAQDGIAVRVFNQYATGVLGEIPFTHAYPELWLIDERDGARAQALVAALRSAASAEAQACTACGEALCAGMLVCWQCGVRQH